MTPTVHNVSMPARSALVVQAAIFWIPIIICVFLLAKKDILLTLLTRYATFARVTVRRVSMSRPIA